MNIFTKTKDHNLRMSHLCRAFDKYNEKKARNKIKKEILSKVNK